MALEDKLNGSSNIVNIKDQLLSDLKSIFPTSTANLLMGLISLEAKTWTGPPLSLDNPSDGIITTFWVDPILSDGDSGNGFSRNSPTNNLAEVLTYISDYLTPTVDNPIAIMGLGEYKCPIKDVDAVVQGIGTGSFDFPDFVSFIAPGWTFTTEDDVAPRDIIHVGSGCYIDIRGIDMYTNSDKAFIKNSGSGFSSLRMSNGIVAYGDALVASTGIDVVLGSLDVKLHTNNAVTSYKVAAVGATFYYDAAISSGTPFDANSVIADKVTDTANYKSFIGVVSQAAAEAPTAVTFKNTLPTAVTWSRTAAGDYKLISAGAFPDEAKIAIFPGSSQSVTAVSIIWSYIDINSIQIKSRDIINGFDGDDAMTKMALEVRVYN